jgi:hypothetical protein
MLRRPCRSRDGVALFIRIGRLTERSADVKSGSFADGNQGRRMAKKRVFISYSKQLPAPTTALATFLQSNGYHVWWDTDIKSGENYRAVIDRELDAADAVVVIWSPGSINSPWVVAEADHASEQKKLVTARSEDVKPYQFPKPYSGVHADLVSDHAAILSGIQQLISSRAEAQRPAPPALQSPPTLEMPSVPMPHFMEAPTRPGRPTDIVRRDLAPIQPASPLARDRFSAHVPGSFSPAGRWSARTERQSTFNIVDMWIGTGAFCWGATAFLAFSLGLEGVDKYIADANYGFNWRFAAHAVIWFVTAFALLIFSNACNSIAREAVGNATLVAVFIAVTTAVFGKIIVFGGLGSTFSLIGLTLFCLTIAIANDTIAVKIVYGLATCAIPMAISYRGLWQTLTISPIVAVPSWTDFGFSLTTIAIGGGIGVMAGAAVTDL